MCKKNLWILCFMCCEGNNDVYLSNLIARFFAEFALNEKAEKILWIARKWDR